MDRGKALATYSSRDLQVSKANVLPLRLTFAPITFGQLRMPHLDRNLIDLVYTHIVLLIFAMLP